MLNNLNKKSIVRQSFSNCVVQVIVSLLLTCNASAQVSESYTAYTADVNGDGVPDFFVKAVPKIIMIPLDDDLDIPIPITPSNSSFILLSSRPEPSQVFILYQIYTSLGDMPKNPLWTQAGVNVAVNAGSRGEEMSFTINYFGSNYQAFTSGMTYAAESNSCSNNTCSTSGFTVSVVTPSVQPSAKVVEKYQYNALGRLIRVSRDGVSKAQYDYDNAGNRKQVNE
ncbi:RHS repeat domain-containing protein [Massilia phyllosphaerae]|uniref:RHS repeat domain-containing protein n=1 Tax=Massilia phyllosphaerae TaxID=3106034 RepID=UPI002B1CAD7C|nr:RHS repeat domain-containing protein [Massilia sp. SGZ-792]